MENTFHANGNKKNAGVTMLTLDKTDFKIKTERKDRERPYIMIEGSSQ